jgi:hypothetical protein
MKNRTSKGYLVCVDGHATECQRGEGESLDVVVDRMISTIPATRTVTGVFLNGKQTSRAELESVSSEDGVVDIRTMLLSELLKEVLSDLTLHLDSLMTVFQEIGNNLRRGDLPAVFASSNGATQEGGVYMQGLEGIVAAQVLVEEVGRIERQAGHDSFRLSFIEENDRIESVLSGMLKSQESQDWILLADLVEYEILPILQRGRIKTSRALAEIFESEKKDRLVVA